MKNGVAGWNGLQIEETLGFDLTSWRYVVHYAMNYTMRMPI